MPQIFIKNPRGDIISVKIDDNDSLQIIKYHIQKLEGIPVAQQSLVFEGEEIHSVKLLKKYCFSNSENNIELIVKQIDEPIEIIIQHKKTKDTLSLFVNKIDTILQIKEKIKDLKGIAVEQQTLSYKSKLLENNENLEDLNVKNLSTLILSVPKNKNQNCYIM